jgi:chemotaxis regulatin CheY-phosphate phosphatase CheZ
MSDDSVALATLPPAPPPSDHDYEAILGAVMETVRGRWFLTEYARRNRNADTELVLAAIERLPSLRPDSLAPPDDRLRFDLIEMAKAIARTRAEIAAIKPDAEHDGKIVEASEELDAIVRTTENATSEVLAAAEQIQETAWTMREADIDAAFCDTLDARATDIYTACSFQDLTGQRIRKVIGVLHYLEARINAMIAIWGDKDYIDAGEATAGLAPPVAAPSGADLDQADIDMVLQPAAPEPPAPEAAAEPPHVADLDVAEPEPDSGADNTVVAPEDVESDNAREDDELGERDSGAGTIGFMAVGLQEEVEVPALVIVAGTAQGDKAALEEQAPAETAPHVPAADAQADTPPATVVDPTPDEPGPTATAVAAETTDVAVAAPATEAAPAVQVPAAPARDPLADIRALSEEEKIALCS